MNPREAIERIEAAGFFVMIDFSQRPLDAFLCPSGVIFVSSGEVGPAMRRIPAPTPTEQQLRWFNRHKYQLIAYLLEESLDHTERRANQAEKQVADLQHRVNLLELYRQVHRMESAQTAIPPNIVRRLRSLCHPDRWQNTPQEGSATEVMQWLNGLEVRS